MNPPTTLLEALQKFATAVVNRTSEESIHKATHDLHAMMSGGPPAKPHTTTVGQPKTVSSGGLTAKIVPTRISV